MRFVVTGGAGYIGSHTCKLLLELGHEVFVLDNFSTGHKESARWGQYAEVDVCNEHAVVQLMRDIRPDVVIHLAALAEVQSSMENPSSYLNHNLQSTVSVLEAMRVTGVRNLVFSSSCAVYGVPSKMLLDEDEPLEPVNAYGLSKKICEDTIRSYSNMFEIGAVSLRYFNAAGGDPSGWPRERHEPETHLIPRVIRGCLEIHPKVTINGMDYPTDDGTCVRDFVHVQDIAYAHLASAEFLMSGGETTEFNLGSEVGYSVKQVVTLVAKVLSVEPEISVGPRRLGDPPYLRAAADRARDVLKWKPERSNLDQIVADALIGFSDADRHG